MLPPLSSTPYVIGFCPTKKVDFVGVRRPNGEYYKYCLDEKAGMLKPLDCLECQPTITERDLRPHYAIYCPDLRKYVIFASNEITQAIEQYTFNQSTGGFEQIEHGILHYTDRIPDSEIICVIDSNKRHSETMIQKDRLGFFLKLRYINETKSYHRIPSVYVKTLLMKKLELEDLMRDINDEEEKEEKSENTPELANDSMFNDKRAFIPQYCEKLQCYIICVRLPNGTYLRTHYNYNLGYFVEVESDEFQTGPTEQDLYPVYAVFNHSLAKYVIFMKNYKNFKIEQYTFCSNSGSFEQVHIPEMKFDANLETVHNSLFYVKYSVDDTLLEIQRGVEGYVVKILHVKNGNSCQLLCRPVKTLDRAENADDEVERATENQQVPKTEEEKQLEEEYLFMKSFPYDDEQDEWAAKAFSKFLSAHSSTDLETMQILKQRHDELAEEVRMRIERCMRFPQYDIAQFNDIVDYKVSELEELETILAKHLPGFVAVWNDDLTPKEDLLEDPIDNSNPENGSDSSDDSTSDSDDDESVSSDYTIVSCDSISTDSDLASDFEQINFDD